MAPFEDSATCVNEALQQFGGTLIRSHEVIQERVWRNTGGIGMNTAPALHDVLVIRQCQMDDLFDPCDEPENPEGTIENSGGDL